MNNWNVYKAISEFFNSVSSAELAILIFILLNIIITLFNSWVQFRLKRKERENISFKLKEEKKIVIYESLFDKIQNLNYLNPEKDKDEYLNKITELEKSKELNKLYVCNKTSIVITDFCDYCKVLLTDYRKKDLKKEDKFVNNFKNLYNK